MDEIAGNAPQEQLYSDPAGPLQPQQVEPVGVQQATWHPGVVTVLKKSYGFIRSAHCHGDVFFHSSSVAATPPAEAPSVDNAADNSAAGVTSTPAQLVVGTIVSFTLDPGASAGKLAAGSVCILNGPAACCNPLELVSSAVLVGRLARMVTTTADGLVRYMEEGVVVKHVTCRATPALLGMPVGTPVAFRLLTDLRQLHATQHSSNPHAWHAAHRATDVAVLGQEHKAVLPAAAKQQLLTLKLLSTAFNAAGQQ